MPVCTHWIAFPYPPESNFPHEKPSIKLCHWGSNRWNLESICVLSALWQRTMKICSLLTIYFSDGEVSCFPPNILMEGNTSLRENSKSFPFTSLLISCTITTLSVCCQQDCKFNFVAASPDAVRSWHKSSAAGCRGLLYSGPLTVSNIFWKGDRLYSGSGIYHCQPPLAPPSWCCLAWVFKLWEPSGLCSFPLHHLYFLLSEALQMSHWKCVCWAEKRAAAQERMQKKNVLCSLIYLD